MRRQAIHFFMTPAVDMFSKQRRRKSSIFSSSSSSYSSRYSRRQKKIPTPVLIGAIPLTLLAVELLLRLGVGIAGKSAEINAYQGEPAIDTAYRFQPLTSENQPIKGLPGYGQLAVQSNPLKGYQLMPNQANAAWNINAQGFRSTEDIPTSKPQDEVRILIIGGASAFGAFATNNQVTFAQQLENRLNQQVEAQKANPAKFRPDVLPYFADELEQVLKKPPKIRAARYRVINAAVPGYLASNTLADFTTRLQQYQPNMVVLINGYSDLLTPADRAAATLPIEQLAAHPFKHLGASISQSVQGLVNQLYLTKTIRYWILKPQPKIAELVNPLGPQQPLADQLTDDPEQLNQRIDRYRRSLEALANLTNTTKTPLIVALSPALHQLQPDQQTAAEKQRLATLGQPYQERIELGYQSLEKSIAQVKSKRSNVIPMPLTKTLNQIDGEVFQDTINLTDAAQQPISDRLYQTIANMLQVQPIPFGSNSARKTP